MIKKQAIWNDKIFSIVKYYVNHPDVNLFGITGDINNLGVYVAQNGRSKAENLVDIYNQLISNFMDSYVEKHCNKIKKFYLMTSGEEVFALGAVADYLSAENFFITISNTINNFIQFNFPLAPNDVTISFGCKIFSNKSILQMSDNFVKQVSKENIKKSNLAYFELMNIMRDELSYELDSVKFNSLNAKELELIILFRNVVYANLLNYKETTQKCLNVLSDKAIKNEDIRKLIKESILNRKYGISDKERKMINKIIANNGLSKKEIEYILR